VPERRNPFEVLHVSVSINRPPEAVYAFAAEIENLPKWAAGLCKTIRSVNGEWIAEGGPTGPVKVRFTEANALGVLDHDVVLSSGAAIHNPIRVVPNGAGSEVTFTLLRQPGVSAATFGKDAKAVERDLRTLKALLEEKSAAPQDHPAGSTSVTGGLALNPQLLGRAENAHRALLGRILADTGITYQQWVALTLTAFGGASVGRDLLIQRMTDALKIDDVTVTDCLRELTASGLLEPDPTDTSRVRLTGRGEDRYRELRQPVDEAMKRVYAGVAAEDLQAAGRVLAMITQRVDAELAARQ
jgi:uncharacterized protein YndB with AHSA1/START domain